MDGNAEIQVSGVGQKKEFPDGWIQYSGFRGTASIKGSRIRVIIAGVDIDLHAAGRVRFLERSRTISRILPPRVARTLRRTSR